MTLAHRDICPKASYSAKSILIVVSSTNGTRLPNVSNKLTSQKGVTGSALRISAIRLRSFGKLKGNLLNIASPKVGNPKSSISSISGDGTGVGTGVGFGA